MSPLKAVLTIFVVLVSLLQLANATPPPYIHPCNTTDSECLIKATREAIPDFAKGIPEFGIPPLDPYIVDGLKLNLPGGLEFSFYDGKSTGLRNCIVNNVRLELGKFQEIDVNCNLTMKGKYKSKGKILLFSIDGNGDAKIKITNMRMVVKQKMNLITDEMGIHRMEIESYTYHVDYQGNVHFQMTNLFKGNPEISQAILAFMNENWKLIVDEFGKPILDYFADLSNENVKKFYKNVAYEDLIGVPFEEAIKA